MARQTVNFTVNGDHFEVTTDVRRSLAEVLREDLGLVGTKIGCNQGDCGACTVLLDGQSISSCLLLAVEADGRQVTTIEGLAPSGDRLHPVQQAFVDKGAVQCGFCSPGMVMRAIHLLADNPDPTEEEIRRGLSGNLCRCTGYNKIVEAIGAAAEAKAAGRRA